MKILCRALKVSRSGFYAWQHRIKSTRAKENEHLLERIKTTYNNSRGTYGSPRIHAQLRREGLCLSRKRVARLMKLHGIVAKTYRRKKKSCFSSMPMDIENLVNRQFKVPQPNRIWASDITYIATRSGWLYLAVVMDLYSRRIVGWTMSGHLGECLAHDALDMALLLRHPPKNLIHHSDRGGQYTGESFRQKLRENSLRLSMNPKGSCYDNAVVESFFKSLKSELGKDLIGKDVQQTRSILFEYIEIFYNRQRLHSTLNYRSPAEFEAQLSKPSVH